MPVLDRTTRRLIESLKARIKFLTALVVILALALTIMTVMYATKGKKNAAEAPATSDVSSAVNNPSNTESVIDSSSVTEQSSSNTTSKTGSSSQSATSSSNSTSSNVGSSTPTAATGDSLDSWNLTLVNGKSPLPNGFTVKTEKIKAAYARDVGMLFDARAVSYLNAMCAAAEKDGVNLLVISSHRTNARQTTLYNNQVAKQKANNPNLSDDEVKKLAATISAYPGTSEHELGLAVDFNSVETSFENTPQYQWLKTHAAEYGFVMRYAKEKQNITGVIYEPWHYRFVGKNHAEKINQLGYCLEEYVNYLKQNK